jgi:hypothetical protein
VEQSSGAVTAFGVTAPIDFPIAATASAVGDLNKKTTELREHST